MGDQNNEGRDVDVGDARRRLTRFVRVRVGRMGRIDENKFKEVFVFVWYSLLPKD